MRAATSVLQTNPATLLSQTLVTVPRKREWAEDAQLSRIHSNLGRIKGRSPLKDHLVTW